MLIWIIFNIWLPVGHQLYEFNSTIDSEVVHQMYTNWIQHIRSNSIYKFYVYRFLAQLRSMQDPPITPWLVPAWVTWWLPFCDIRNWLNLIQHSPSNLVTKNSIVTKVVDPMSPTMHFPSLPQRIRVFFEANTYFYVLDIFELNSTHLRLVAPEKILCLNFCQH